MESNKIRIVFMGTPDFAVASLAALVEHGYDVSAVVTVPDKPAGRGQKIKKSAVKAFAEIKNIPLLQPDNLKDTGFIQQLRTFNATLFVVVAFRMLPEEVWGMPPLGTFNLHASLLPQYRGAAPINRMIMNGERLGGVTTFFLRQAIDTGNIIFREETGIGASETAGEYHDRLKEMGASLLVKTVEAIRIGSVRTINQDELIAEGEVLKIAPKINKEDCRIRWGNTAENVFDLIRGLSPYPGAYTEITTVEGKKLYLKIYKAVVRKCRCEGEPGTLRTDYKNYLDVCCKHDCISVLELQQAGKKRMMISDFLAGLNSNTLI